MADEKVDPNRYYYRPGTTEPELRPEVAIPAKSKKIESTESVKAKAKPVSKKK